MAAGITSTTRPGVRGAIAAAAPAAPVALAMLGALALGLAGWHGKDYAAATYRIEEFRRHGWVLWDTGWYGGNYPLGYSVLFPPLGALVGLTALGVLAAGACTWSFDHLVRRWWGARPRGSWLFPLSTILAVGIGQFPYLSGEALALAAVVAATRRRLGLALVAGVAAALCSGVAAAFLAVACLGWTWTATNRRRGLIALAVIPIVVLGGCNVAFPGTGTFPYPWAGMALTVLACAAAFTPPLAQAPAVRAGAVLYAVLAVGSFLIASPMGGNASRLAQSVGIPLLACFVLPPSRGPRHTQVRQGVGGRAVLGVILVPLLVWQWGPGENVVEGVSRAPATTARYYQPLIAALAARAPEPVRVEVVPTQQHWEAVYLPSHEVLARGWERQLDIGDNPVFYRRGALQPASYRRWLLDSGVSFVALATAPLDYAGVAEGRLLRSGRVPGLILVWHSARWQLWRVEGAPGLVSGPGVVTAVQPDTVTIAVTHPGTLTVRVRWTRYWTRRAGDACIGPGPGGWTTVRAAKAGVVRLGTTLDLLDRRGHC